MEVEAVDGVDNCEHQSSTEAEIEEDVIVKFNPMPRSRGRPAVIQQRTFAVGKKRAKTIQCGSAKKKRKRNVEPCTPAPELDSDDMDKLLANLKVTHPIIGGLQSTILGSNARGGCVPLFTAERERFVQVLNAGDHWVVVSNLLTNNLHAVHVYDSLHHNAISHQIQVQVSSLLRCFDRPDQITYHLRDVHQQDANARLCGFYAAAAALSLCSGIDPTANVYDDDKLVLDIHQRLRNGTNEPITCILRQGKPMDSKVFQLKKIHCTCQKSSDASMICCDGCGSWFHQRCVGPIPVSATAKTGASWLSDVCCANGKNRTTQSAAVAVNDESSVNNKISTTKADSMNDVDRSMVHPMGIIDNTADMSEKSMCRNVAIPISVPGAVGVVLAPVRAFVQKELWDHLPPDFLDSAILNNHASEKLLREADVDNVIVTTIVSDYVDDANMRRHPVLPLTSAARKIKDGLRPILFNVLIDCYENDMKDLYEFNVCQ